MSYDYDFYLFHGYTWLGMKLLTYEEALDIGLNNKENRELFICHDDNGESAIEHDLTKDEIDDIYKGSTRECIGYEIDDDILDGFMLLRDFEALYDDEHELFIFDGKTVTKIDHKLTESEVEEIYNDHKYICREADFDT